MNVEKPSIPIMRLVNWYHGNYCTRKCYNDQARRNAHLPRLIALAEKLKDVKMTHREFLNMIRIDKTICDLSDEEWKNRKFSWKNDDCILCKKFGRR